MNKILFSILLSLSPISELRGGIVYGIASGIDPYFAFFVCTLANLFISPLLFLFLLTLHNTLYKLKTYKKIFNVYARHVWKKAKKYEKRHKIFGYFALSMFVATPLPTTGAWTATLIAFLLGLDKKKSIISISIGVIISGIIVASLTSFGIKLL